MEYYADLLILQKFDQKNTLFGINVQKWVNFKGIRVIFLKKDEFLGLYGYHTFDMFRSLHLMSFEI